jgi:glycosyltransferase involved in cell wall biosynthesis
VNKASLRVSVLITTKNEQSDLPGCLQSVAWCDDIHLFDSGSTDETLAIAKLHGAHITQRTYPHTDAPFGGDEGAHRTWGLRHIAFKHEWLLLLDADERVTPELIAAMRRMLDQPGPCSAYQICRRDFFLGTWIRHVTPSPMHIRLLKPAAVHYERLINPVTVVQGEVGELDAFFDHFPFSKGIGHWFAKHNGYSSLEARQIAHNHAMAPSYKLSKALFAADVHERRLHQKGLYYRLPMRPLVMFMGLYVGKRGFLDGRAGFVFAVLRAIYEYMIVLKVEELRARARAANEQPHRNSPA